MSTQTAVEGAIRQLLLDYVAEPAGLLREVGQQVHLRGLLASRLQPASCAVELGDGSKPREWASTPWAIGRVQLEAKVPGLDRRPTERSDVVVLRASSTVRLRRYGKGAMDIVAHLPLENIEAVIEIKAACSADPAQRAKFCSDVVKLLRLPSDHEVERHFVLVDKSLPLGPTGLHKRFIEKKPPVLNWHEGGEFVVPDLEPAVPNGPSVHLWDLEPLPGGGAKPRQRRAFKP